MERYGVRGAICALIALGYTMVCGVLRLINFAHSEIFMIGSFAALFGITVLGISAPVTGVLLFVILIAIMLIAAAVVGGAAMLLEVVAYRPLRRRNAPRLARLISAIGASLFLQELFALHVIPEIVGRPGRIDVPVPRIMEREVLFTIGNADVRSDQLLVIVAAILVR